MIITADTIVSWAALIAAVIALVSYYNRAFKWVEKQNKQDNDIQLIKAEQKILMKGILACLKGLSE